MCVCVYVCVCVCVYVCMYVCMYVHMYVCMYECVYVCTYVCMYMCIYMYVCTVMYGCMHVYLYVYMYVCMNVCTYVFFIIFIGMLHYIRLVILHALYIWCLQSLFLLYSMFYFAFVLRSPPCWLVTVLLNVLFLVMCSFLWFFLTVAWILQMFVVSFDELFFIYGPVIFFSYSGY
jgi:hypothetical protein